MPWKQIWKAAILSTVMAFAFGCRSVQQGSNNVLFDISHDPVLFSSDEELAMGAQALPEVLKQYKPYQDSALNAYVDSVGQRIAKVSDRNNIPYHFTVVDSTEVNAFALPGGYIFITTGLLKNLNNEAELGAVLGHEVGHVVQRHALKQLQRQMLIQLGLNGLEDLAGKERAQLIQLAGGLGANLLLLRNSRQAELQADQEGLKNASRAGLDPSAMLRVQEMLKGLSQGSPNVVANMLATHPTGDERIAQAKALLPEYKGPTALNAGPYQEALKKLKASPGHAGISDSTGPKNF